MKTKFKKILPSDFPALLKEINDPPRELYLEGDLPRETECKFLAVVGSRKYSRYGKEACEELIAGLAGYPIVIVSGLALGIDTIAHQSALKNNLLTIAIPGSGLDRRVLHPFSNHCLADEIIERGGCLLSELEPECPAGLHTFPRRNRIMAGLSHATLIIEAGERSGTLITSRLAMEYNRDVLVVPGSIFSPSSRGANSLIRQGATPINNSNDLLQALGFNLDEEEKEKQGRLFIDLSPIEQKIVGILESESLPRDELIEVAELTTAEANILLSTMEIKGLIKEAMGEIRLA
ncbi:MAG TPA: DNA-processing protein DprA [Candidatus Paceibacterota bacterium]|nr:DNA-processing protein DprA [Candidatus Paceibacterota bacterium]